METTNQSIRRTYLIGKETLDSILGQTNRTEQLTQILSQTLEQFDSLILDGTNLTGIKFQHDNCNFVGESISVEGSLEETTAKIHEQIRTWLVSSLDAIRNHQGEINVDDFTQQILALHYDIEFSENFERTGELSIFF